MTVHNLRRSTRVPLKVVIAIEGGAATRTCDGETIVVNLQGALIATGIALSTGMRISIHVYVTDKRAAARVFYVDPENPLHCGIALDEPRNIWGVPLPPNDWDEKVASETVLKPRSAVEYDAGERRVLPHAPHPQTTAGKGTQIKSQRENRSRAFASG